MHSAAHGPQAPRLCWSVLRCRVPSDAAALRSSVWRELSGLGALNLQYGQWALPHGLDHERVDALLARVAEAGGEATAVPTGPADVEMDRRLTRACERLWDSFFNAIDQFATRLDQGALTPAAQLESLDALRAQFVPNLMRDLVGSDAASRAAARLASATATVLAGLPADERLTEADRNAKRRVEVVAVRLLDDGSLRCVARIDPLPSAGWQDAFDAFEAVAYTASETRSSLCHGTFCWTVAPAELEASLASVERRVELAAAYVG